MIQPKEIEIDEKVFIISKLPAMCGREIITQYLPTATPKIGNYQDNEKLALKLLSFTAIKKDANGSLEDNNLLPLATRALVDNHAGSWETVVKLEVAMMEYNCSFFQNGLVSNFFEAIAQKIPALISKILTDSLAQLSPTVKPLSES